VGLQWDQDRQEKSSSNGDSILGRLSPVTLWKTKISSEPLWHYSFAIEEFIIFGRTT
jgi:hypothetical protein